MTHPRIFFLSDFGHTDAYVGVVKAVISKIACDARVIDLAHEVPPQDLRAGSFALYAALPYLPHRSIVLAVIDPGVGGDRLPIVIETEHFTFVGPDNGLFGAALSIEPPKRIFVLENRALRLTHSSRTFDGRDVFGPAAAHVATAIPLEEFGRALPASALARAPALPTEESSGEIWTFDRYGNAITTLRAAPDTTDEISIEGRRLSMATHFGAVAEGAPTAIVGSAGLVEIAVRNGSARSALGLQAGWRVARRASSR
jgi:S-adenosylmethionine hydrolase